MSNDIKSTVEHEKDGNKELFYLSSTEELVNLVKELLSKGSTMKNIRIRLGHSDTEKPRHRCCGK
jgi:hypothetical protein